MIAGYRQTQLVYLAAKQQIADHLASGPQSVAALAAATSSNSDALYRVLRALASLGVFREEADRRFSLTPCCRSAAERGGEILATCHRALSPEAKLLVIEDLVCGPNVPCDAKIGDINMLARTGGKNRTREEYGALLEASRFAVTRVLPASGDLAIIEAVAR